MILFVLLFLFPIINYAELSAIVTSETDLNGIEERSSGLTQALGQSFSPLGRCQSTDNGDFGTCMSTRTACTKAGGTVNGYCGTVGFCCSRKLQCNETSTLKRTILQNPSTFPDSCSYRIESYDSKVCQLRIDFDMILAQPTFPENSTVGSPRCLQDSLSIGDLVLCGVNMKQHVYIPIQNARGSSVIELMFKIANRFTEVNLSAVYWSMLVTQLECGSDEDSIMTMKFTNLTGTINGTLNQTRTLKAVSSFFDDYQYLSPSGCLQYFYEPSGIVESFNYNSGWGPYLPDLNYAICFKRSYNQASIKYEFSETFKMSGSTFNLLNPHDATDSECFRNNMSDYLLIPNAIAINSYGESIAANYFCGTSLAKATVTCDLPGPLAIYVHTDSDFLLAEQERGFQFTYSRYL